LISVGKVARIKEGRSSLKSEHITNSMAYGTRRFKAAFTRAL